jgi:hypothetical protein
MWTIYYSGIAPEQETRDVTSLLIINIAAVTPRTSTVMVQNAVDHRFFIVAKGLSAMLW